MTVLATYVGVSFGSVQKLGNQERPVTPYKRLSRISTQLSERVRFLWRIQALPPGRVGIERGWQL